MMELNYYAKSGDSYTHSMKEEEEEKVVVKITFNGRSERFVRERIFTKSAYLKVLFKIKNNQELVVPYLIRQDGIWFLRDLSETELKDLMGF